MYYIELSNNYERELIIIERNSVRNGCLGSEIPTSKSGTRKLQVQKCGKLQCRSLESSTCRSLESSKYRSVAAVSRLVEFVLVLQMIVVSSMSYFSLRLCESGVAHYVYSNVPTVLCDSIALVCD